MTIYNITSCDQLQTVINNASDGDTIQILIDCTLTTPITINKRITVSGGGTYTVDANHNDIGNYPVRLNISGSGRFVINITTPGTERVTINGIHFDGDPGVGSTNCYISNATGFIIEHNENIADFHIHDNKFHNTGLTTYMNITMTTRSTFSTGLISKCYFISDSLAGQDIFTMRVTTNESDKDPQYCGTVSFGQDIIWGGGTNWLFVEDCTFIRPSGDPSPDKWGVAFDSVKGGRIIFRHNYCLNDWIETHMISGGGWNRGSTATEVYNNTFIWQYSTNRYQCAYYHRSGTSLIHNNHFEGYQVAVKYSGAGRLTSVNQGNYGTVDGTKPWDGNTTPIGYPVLDQSGRGKTASGNYVRPNAPSPLQPQELKPVRMWSNTYYDLSGACSGTRRHGLFLCIADDVAYSVQDRDYYFSDDNTAAELGYVPYIYPHPFIICQYIQIKFEVI